MYSLSDLSAGNSKIKLSVGFVLRIWVGGIATGIGISQWIVLMTFLLALFLAFAKRRDDVVMYEESGVKVRCDINRYNLQFMNQDRKSVV